MQERLKSFMDARTGTADSSYFIAPIDDTMSIYSEKPASRVDMKCEKMISLTGVASNECPSAFGLP
jgi:hypothetical protein